MQKAAVAVFGTQAVYQLGGVAALGGAQGIGVPLRRIAVGGGHEGGLAAHGQAHIARFEFAVHIGTECLHARPLLVGVGQGDAG